MGNCAIARRTCPSASPSCSRRTSTVSMAVPETTPSWPCRDTARASVQLETPMPIPPWMIAGCDPRGLPGIRRDHAGIPRRLPHDARLHAADLLHLERGRADAVGDVALHRTAARGERVR